MQTTSRIRPPQRLLSFSILCIVCVRARPCLHCILVAALQGSFSSFGCEADVLEEFGGKGKGGGKGKKKVFVHGLWSSPRRRWCALDGIMVAKTTCHMQHTIPPYKGLEFMPSGVTFNITSDFGCHPGLLLA